MATDSQLKGVFKGVQESLQCELQRVSNNVDHPVSKGDVHEGCWIELFQKYLPRRYAVDKGFIVDSKGYISEQIDVVIYDPQYTPLLYLQKSLKYIPAEAVYAVFECKPEINKDYLKYSGKKIASVRNLHRTSATIYHAGKSPFEPKKPFDIIGGILAAKAGWSKGLKSESFIKNLPAKKDHVVDCACALSGGSYFAVELKADIKMGDTSLMYFLFKLLDRLQRLGTVPAIDWQAYAKVLD
jgi:hypothetical protein